MANKQTQKDAASKASKVLRDGNASSKQKSAAGSAMSQKDMPHKKSGEGAASKASSVLRDGSASSHQKAAAGSTLSQKEK